MSRAGCVGRRDSTSRRYNHGSWPCIRADCTKLMTVAARLPASSLPAKNHAFLLCEASHNRKNWLFAGSLMAGQRAAAITSLIQSAKLNGHDPYPYLPNVLTRWPTHLARDLDDLLPHRWRPTLAGRRLTGGKSSLGYRWRLGAAGQVRALATDA